MPGISITNLRKEFGNFVAIDDLSLEVGDGDFCVVLGPSGCGKSTTLNCIAGLERSTSGEIHIGDRDVTNLPPHERDIAMVFQSSLLYPHLNAKKNILTSVLHSNVDETVTRNRFNHAVRILDIEHLLNKKPSEMSGGERQRVAMAKAIVRDPACFLMDEPLAALDAALRQSLRTELTHLQRKLGVTTIFVTHDQVEAMTMGDMIVVMNKGKIVQYGSPLEIYQNPASKFVAGFVGSPQMNFFPGRIVREGDDAKFVGQFLNMDIPSDNLIRQGVNERRVDMIGVRPENMSIVAADAPGSIPMEIYSIEHLGKESIVVLTNDGQFYRIIVPSETNISIGENVHISIDGASCHFFAPDEGQQIRRQSEYHDRTPA